MSVISVVFRKFCSIFRFIYSGIKLLVSFVLRRKRSTNIGELPFTVSKEDRIEYQSTTAISPGADTLQSWENWSDQSFITNSKIAEYREQQRRRIEQTKQNSNDTDQNVANNEVDFFNEMQPQFKPTKKLKLRTEGVDNVSSNKNIFEVRENEVILPEASMSVELGDLEFSHDSALYNSSLTASNGHTGNLGTDNWEESALGDRDLDILAQEQKRREREEKHKQRQAEHERQLMEKRRQFSVTSEKLSFS